jgi:hypothetical protein
MLIRLPSVLLAVPLLLAISGCNGPFLVMPGGKLEGEVVPPPSDWGFAGDDGLVELETLPEDPYSVNIVYTVVGGVIYLNAGDTETQWVKNMNADPRIRLRLDGTIYDLRAERVTDAGEIEEFARAWTNQSMFRRDPTELDAVWIYRLSPR